MPGNCDSPRSASPKSASANGRWTSAACSPVGAALATPSLGIPALIETWKRAHGGDAARRRIADRKERSASARSVWAKWQDESRKDWDAAPMTVSRLAIEVWDVIKNEDWVLTADALKSGPQALGLRPAVSPSRRRAGHLHPDRHLARRRAGAQGQRIVVDIQPDGDLMFDAGALWIAAKNEIPLLVVMYNNRAYYNDWEHQIRMAKLRGTDVARRISAWTVRPRAGFRGAGAIDGRLRRGADRESEGRQARVAAGTRGGEERSAGAGRYHHAAQLDLTRAGKDSKRLEVMQTSARWPFC